MKQSFIILMVAVLLGCSKNEEESEYFPITELNSDFSVSDSLLTVGEDLELKTQFDTVDVHYYWDFGDGNYSTEKNPIHWYNHSGDYKIKLRVNDKYNNVDSTERIVRVGYCYAYELEIIYLWDFKNNAETIPWDEDSIGSGKFPDVFLTIKNSEDPPKTLYKSPIIYNCNPIQLPLRFQIPEIKIHEGVVSRIPGDRFEIAIYDNDGNQSELIASNRPKSILSFSGLNYFNQYYIGEYVVKDSYCGFKIKYKIK